MSLLNVYRIDFCVSVWVRYAALRRMRMRNFFMNNIKDIMYKLQTSYYERTMLENINPYIMSFIAACVVYIGLVLRFNSTHVEKGEERVWLHMGSGIYAGAIGALTFAAWYFLIKNGSVPYKNSTGNPNSIPNPNPNPNPNMPVLPNRPLVNKSNTRLNSNTMNRTDASVIGYTGERVMSDPYK